MVARAVTKASRRGAGTNGERGTVISRLARASAADFLAGGGEMGALLRGHDWSTSPVGPPESWPQSLRSAVSILLPSRAQICLFWGPDLIAIYNDPYRPTLGIKHPWALGRPAREVWSEFWDDVLRPLLTQVVEDGNAFWGADYPFFLERNGFPEETYFDISYDPVRDESGGVGGVFCIVSETTGRVVGERRLKTLRQISEVASGAALAEEACRPSCQSSYPCAKPGTDGVLEVVCRFGNFNCCKQRPTGRGQRESGSAMLSSDLPSASIPSFHSATAARSKRAAARTYPPPTFQLEPDCTSPPIFLPPEAT